MPRYLSNESAARVLDKRARAADSASREHDHGDPNHRRDCQKRADQARREAAELRVATSDCRRRPG